MAEFSRYVVKRKLREIGGYLTVFQAHQRGLDRDVELRVLQAVLDQDSEVYAKFQAECRVLAGLDHPGILKILDLGHSGQRVFYVTDTPPGISIRDYVAQGQAPVEVVVEVGQQLCAALQYLHARGLIHRGLSLGGVHYDLMTGRVLITDFSLLKNLAVEVPSMRSLLETDTFEALPERAAGRTVDARADLFLASAILYALCTGVDPLAPEQLARTVDYQFKSPRELNDEVPAELDGLIMRALAKSPDDRPRSAEKMLEALEAARMKMIVRRVSRTSASLSVSEVRAALAGVSGKSEVPVEDEPAVEPAALAQPEPLPPTMKTEREHPAAYEAGAMPTMVAGRLDDRLDRLAAALRDLHPAVPAAVGALVMAAAIGVYALVRGGPAPQPAEVTLASADPAAERSGGVRSSADPGMAAGPIGREESPPLERRLEERDDGTAPADIGELVAAAAALPTSKKSFKARWESLRKWAEQMPRSESPPPFSPMELTAVRLRIYRDAPAACIDLDHMLEKVGVFLQQVEIGAPGSGARAPEDG